MGGPGRRRGGAQRREGGREGGREEEEGREGGREGGLTYLLLEGDGSLFALLDGGLQALDLLFVGAGGRRRRGRRGRRSSSSRSSS